MIESGKSRMCPARHGLQVMGDSGKRECVVGGRNMKRFIVCDDDPAFVMDMAQRLHELYPGCFVEHMYGPDALEVSLRQDISGADVLLVDIELNGKSSIDLIKKYLRPSSPAQVIYVTGYMHYCTEVYDTRHCGFLVKPIDNGRLKHAVELACQAYEREAKSGVPVKSGGGLRIISAPSLLYVESHGRCLRLVTDEEQMETYEKMKNFAELVDRRFLICHKSFLVNMDRVKQYRGDSFVMDNGQVIPISQTKRREVREIFARYAGGVS